MPVPIYLEWEIKFNEQYLKGLWPVCAFRPVLRYLRKKQNQSDCQSDASWRQAKSTGTQTIGRWLPGRATSRGDLFVYDEAPDEPGDSKVPQAVAIYYVG